MRFVWAVAAFVIAALMIVAGIAERTVFQGPKTESASISVSQEAPYTLIDGAVLNKLPGTQTLRAESDGTIFVAYGRTTDVKAWLADTSYNEVSLGAGAAVSTSLVQPSATPAPAEGTATPAPVAGGDATGSATQPVAGRNPVGSDLWLDEYQQDDLLIAPLQLPDTMSVIVASDGSAPAPASLTVTWPIQNATPWAGPLIVGGGILMLVGVFLYILAIRHVRRSRGPRRKALPPLPETEPIDLAVTDADKGVITATPSRRSLAQRRGFVALPAVAVTALLLSGCSSDAWPQFAGSATPTPTETVIVPEGQDAPAVTEAQAQRILTRVAETVADADAAKDPTMAATRLDGAMLASRSTNYKLRTAISDYASPSAIPTKPLAILLPQAYDGWPRTVMTVVKDTTDATVPPAIMLLTQQDPWSEYKLSYAGKMEASAEIPAVAPSYVGAVQVQPDSSFLKMAPDQLAASYADVLANGDSSPFAGDFDADSDQYRTSVVQDRQKRLDDFNQTASSTGSLTFASSAGSQPAVALATIESGAIVAVNVNEVDTVKPTDADAVIKLDNNPTVKALTGVDQSQTGFTTTFSDQLFFYVPGQGSSEKIRLLGYSSELLDAQVIP